MHSTHTHKKITSSDVTWWSLVIFVALNLFLWGFLADQNRPREVRFWVRMESVFEYEFPHLFTFPPQFENSLMCTLIFLYYVNIWILMKWVHLILVVVNVPLSIKPLLDNSLTFNTPLFNVLFPYTFTTKTRFSVHFLLTWGLCNSSLRPFSRMPL